MGAVNRYVIFFAAVLAFGAAIAWSGNRAVGVPAAASEQSCSVASGKKTFALCVACHSVEAGNNMTGPNLRGVVGRKVASAKGFRYSRALSQIDSIWSIKNLDAFLTSPQKFARGSSMAFGGVRDQQKRADLICYLRSLK